MIKIFTFYTLLKRHIKHFIRLTFVLRKNLWIWFILTFTISLYLVIIITMNTLLFYLIIEINVRKWRLLNIKIKFFLFLNVIKLELKKTILRFIVSASIMMRNTKIITSIIIAQIKTYFENLLFLRTSNKTKSSNNSIKHFLL